MAGLAIDSQGHIVAVDSVTPTIFVLKECGQLIRFHECSDFMKEPSDIGIFQVRTVFYLHMIRISRKGYFTGVHPRALKNPSTIM